MISIIDALSADMTGEEGSDETAVAQRLLSEIASAEGFSEEYLVPDDLIPVGLYYKTVYAVNGSAVWMRDAQTDAYVLLMDTSSMEQEELDACVRTLTEKLEKEKYVPAGYGNPERNVLAVVYSIGSESRPEAAEWVQSVITALELEPIGE